MATASTTTKLPTPLAGSLPARIAASATLYRAYPMSASAPPKLIAPIPAIVPYVESVAMNATATPPAIKVKPVRTHASRVRSFASKNRISTSRLFFAGFHLNIG